MHNGLINFVEKTKSYQNINTVSEKNRSTELAMIEYRQNYCCAMRLIGGVHNRHFPWFIEFKAFDTINHRIKQWRSSGIYIRTFNIRFQASVPINDIHYCTELISIVLFADDTSILHQWRKSRRGGRPPPPPTFTVTNFRNFWPKRGLKTAFSSANGEGGLSKI